MDPHIGDGDAPFGQLLVQIDVIHKGPAGQEVAFEVLHPRLNLAFGLGAVRRADTRLELQYSAKALKVAFQTIRPSVVPRHTVRGRS